MKKIALIMDGWKRLFTYDWPAGMLDRIKEQNEQENLYIFSSSGDWSLDQEYNDGEYNIFRLPDLRDFDGIVVDLNNINNEETKNYLIEKARESKKPVISLANEIEGFYYAGIDNYDAMWKIMEHLHREHHCNSYWMIMGSTDNYENVQRIHAVKDYMHQHDLSFGEDELFCENFEFQCGTHGFQKLLEKKDGILPDAIVCANDNIAVGVCEAAAKYGYRVPEDFIVTGFDDFDKARYYEPRITTVGHIRREVGYLCVQMLEDIWKGISVPQKKYTRITHYFWESCGCTNNEKIDTRTYVKNQMIYGIEKNAFDEEMLAFEYELMKCKSIADMICCMPQCIPSVKSDAIYLVLDPGLNHFKDKKNNLEIINSEEEDFCTVGYPEQMKLEFAYENGRILEITGEIVNQLFPMFEHEKAGKDYLFLPLHFRNKTVGYLVLRNAIYLMQKQYLFDVVNALTNAMENLYKKEKLECMNGALSEISLRDSMTALYNRMGYQKLAVKRFEECKRRKENLMITFIDMDSLKYINDTFGHDYGDIAITAVAQAIQASFNEDSIKIRNGGDEFVVIQNSEGKEDQSIYIKKIRKELTKIVKEKNLPFTITVSLGSVRTDMDLNLGLNDYVSMADEVMYHEKVNNKRNR